jgi:predicted nucleotidyltransferase component of viral defense system
MGCDGMARLIDILKELIGEMRKDNPFGLVLKGGTALAVHHLPGHRESEDLDFDVPIEHRRRCSEVVRHIKGLLEELKVKGVVVEFEVAKEGFAATDRYHISVVLVTHRRYRTKIDLNFTEMTGDLETEGGLRFYSSERMLVDKMLTFSSRHDLKDFYDISKLVAKVDIKEFKEPGKVAALVDAVVKTAGTTDMIKGFSKTLEETDLRFRDLKPSSIGPFVKKTVRDLQRFRNQLLKQA